MSIGDFPESLSQAMLVGVMLMLVGWWISFEILIDTLLESYEVASIDASRRRRRRSRPSRPLWRAPSAHYAYYIYIYI